MKLVHIVIAKFKPEISEATRQQACDEVLKLKDQIPNILSCTAGKTFTERSQGYEWGWVVELEKKEDLPIYAEHAAHQAFLQRYKPTFEDLIALDYMC
ncbi:stress responsive A/B barrel domain-containing protein [Zychaea mexicana]|uniref:stress responsive A/B barrel domain-containing protein n=1 Tax=Zychaea mexicana TaxID=64656 RepID=UPI0022FDFDAB|nr:stress responsive A/B barrel domain-containing protein [Zychaea mexicana]KAI9497498.1 stress responsive A/B barrel domain-containing protein [Zychaea mexicana]